MSCVVREVAWRAPACNLPSHPRPQARTPICEKHLCRFGRSPYTARGPRCYEVPLRLVYSVRDSGGLLPDDTESYFCELHDSYACRASVEDGSRCDSERVSGGEYCEVHGERVCRARMRGGGTCRSVAMEGGEYCSSHRCASMEGKDRCGMQRSRGSAYCDGHVCIWRDGEGKRCERQSPQRGACCAKHTCGRCEFGAEDGTGSCIYHLCAWGRRGKGREWPPCAESVDKEGYCGRHCGGGIQRSGTVDPARMRRRTRMLEEPVEYVAPAVYEEDDNTEYFSDPEYRPAIPVPRVTKRERSGSTRLMKRLEYRVHDADRGGSSSQGSWSQPSGSYMPAPAPMPLQGSWQQQGNWPQQGSWSQQQGSWPQHHQHHQQHLQQHQHQGSWSQPPQEWSLSLRPWRPSTPY